MQYIYLIYIFWFAEFKIRRVSILSRFRSGASNDARANMLQNGLRHDYTPNIIDVYDNIIDDSAL